MDTNSILVEIIGWLSTFLFLISILMPQRIHLHALGLLTSVTTGIYGYAHGATAIWVKWAIALFFHAYMWFKIVRSRKLPEAISGTCCFAVAGQLKRSFYADEDAFCENRSPNDAEYTIDHFYKKLFKLSETMKTNAGREEALRRTAIMKNYLRDLKNEIALT